MLNGVSEIYFILSEVTETYIYKNIFSKFLNLLLSIEYLNIMQILKVWCEMRYPPMKQNMCDLSGNESALWARRPGLKPGSIQWI